ncbi:MAG TPA: hypothetical protein VGD53_05955 [Actinoallomurus sp.]|jgi:hypothetical protein
MKARIRSELGLAGKTAVILERTDLAGFADSYALIHDELSDEKHKAAKVHLLDLLLERSASIAWREKFDAMEVRKLFREGTPMMWVLTLGLMAGDPSLADGSTILFGHCRLPFQKRAVPRSSAGAAVLAHTGGVRTPRDTHRSRR